MRGRGFDRPYYDPSWSGYGPPSYGPGPYMPNFNYGFGYHMYDPRFSGPPNPHPTNRGTAYNRFTGQGYRKRSVKPTRESQSRDPSAPAPSDVQPSPAKPSGSIKMHKDLVESVAQYSNVDWSTICEKAREQNLVERDINQKMTLEPIKSSCGINLPGVSEDKTTTPLTSEEKRQTEALLTNLELLEELDPNFEQQMISTDDPPTTQYQDQSQFQPENPFDDFEAPGWVGAFDDIQKKNPSWARIIDDYMREFSPYLTYDTGYEVRQLISWVQQKLLLTSFETVLSDLQDLKFGSKDRTLQIKRGEMTSKIDSDLSRRLESSLVSQPKAPLSVTSSHVSEHTAGSTGLTGKAIIFD